MILFSVIPLLASCDYELLFGLDAQPPASLVFRTSALLTAAIDWPTHNAEMPCELPYLPAFYRFSLGSS